MATPIDLHIVISCRSGADQCVGAVVDPLELAKLQSDPDAMPLGGRLIPARGIVVDGEIFVLASGRALDLPDAVPEFTVAGYEQKAAALDAVIAALDAEQRATLAPWWDGSEAETKAAQKGEREQPRGGGKAR